MYLGKVIGTVTATRKDLSLVGAKLLLTQPVDLCGEPCGMPKIMVDTVGAGTGEMVIYASGAAARNAAGKADASIDTAIVGIVDSVDLAQEYHAGQGLTDRRDEEILE